MQRELFLYSKLADFGQPEGFGAGAEGYGIADPCISRFLAVGGREVKHYERYHPLLTKVSAAAERGDLPTVLFCVGVAEKQLRERLTGLLNAGASKLLVYIARSADSEPTRRLVFEAGALCCWDSRAFPEKNELTLICKTDKLPYTVWRAGKQQLPPRARVFVACSYDPSRRLRFEYWVRTGLTLSGLTARYADGYANALGVQGISRQTKEQINECHLMVAILDEPHNPNVIFEVATADACQKPSILFIERGASEPPIDLSERVFAEFGNPEELGYLLHHGLRDAVDKHS